MRKAIIALGILGSLTGHQAEAQTLFSYGNNNVSKDEFLKAYKKNNPEGKIDYSIKSLEEYVNLYALYKMKVKEAEQLHLDTTAAIKSDLENYKTQLARNYLTDKEAKEKLTKEAYDRMQNEVHAAHILIASRSTDDSVLAYKKIDSIYQQISTGKASFDQMAKQYSDDKGAAINGGDVGYFSALQVVYPFENAAYQTAVGNISKPFRTQYGYHIVKVLDKRPSRGMVEVQHILIEAPKSKGEAGIDAAKTRAEQVEKELKAGASFASLVDKYSDDKFSKNNEGKLERFGVGRMDPSFEAAAFELKNPGDVSVPVKTAYGYHIIRLINKYPNESFEKARTALERRVEADSRYTIAKEAYQQKLEKDLGYKEYADNFTAFLNTVPKDSLNTKPFSADAFANMNQPVFEIGGKKYTQYDFAKYAAAVTRGRIAGTKERAFGDLLKMYKSKVMNDVQLASLEKNNEEFRSQLNDYRDGTLLFALMDKNIWTKSSKDTAGLVQYYETNKAKYIWQPGFDGVVYQSTATPTLEKFRDDVNSGTPVQAALDKINTSDMISIHETHDGHYEFSGFPQLKPEDFAAGKVTPVANDGKPGTDFVVYVRKLYPAVTQKTMEEARGPIVSDYQDYLEKSWEQELKTKYPLKVNDKVLGAIKK